MVTIAEVDKLRKDPAFRIFDARAAERYHGRNETIDPVAGHIPGALSAPYIDNLTAEGVFRPEEELHTHYQSLIGDIPPENVIFYCGSGVTSIHNLLAMLHAGMEEARLYAGSWSEWIADGKRPVAT
jgi:thiosulfate/3-mercaptopyruvate sulfurtransferase